VSGRIDLKSVRLKTAQKYSNWLLFYLFFQKQAPFSVLSKESSTFLTKPLFNSLYDPFGSPSRGQKPQEREDVAGYAIASARVLASSAEPVPTRGCR